MKTYKRYVFIKRGSKLDIRVIETYSNYQDLEHQEGYNLLSITKLI